MYWYTSKHVDEHLMCVCVYNCFGNRKVLVSYLYHNVTPHMSPAQLREIRRHTYSTVDMNKKIQKRRERSPPPPVPPQEFNYNEVSSKRVPLCFETFTQTEFCQSILMNNLSNPCFFHTGIPRSCEGDRERLCSYTGRSLTHSKSTSDSSLHIEPSLSLLSSPMVFLCMTLSLKQPDPLL